MGDPARDSTEAAAAGSRTRLAAVLELLHAAALRVHLLEAVVGSELGEHGRTRSLLLCRNAPRPFLLHRHLPLVRRQHLLPHAFLREHRLPESAARPRSQRTQPGWTEAAPQAQAGVRTW